MKKQATIKYRVERAFKGGGGFPIDMLRYDGAYPANETASGIIDNYMSVDRHPADAAANRPVELVATHNGCPNARRWESFNWKVTEVHDEIHGWHAYNGEAVRR